MLLYLVLDQGGTLATHYCGSYQILLVSACTKLPTQIYSPQNFRSMNLIGWVLLNCIVALHRWLLVLRSAVIVIQRRPLIHILANKYPLHKFCLPDRCHTHFELRQRIPLAVGVWLMYIAIVQAEKQSIEPCRTLVMFTWLRAYILYNPKSSTHFWGHNYFN